MRTSGQIERGAPLTLWVDGHPVPGFTGETVATMLMAQGRAAFRRDRQGRPRGLFCNMGTCCECMVLVETPEGAISLRACLLPASDGMRIVTS